MLSMRMARPPPNIAWPGFSGARLDSDRVAIDRNKTAVTRKLEALHVESHVVGSDRQAGAPTASPSTRQSRSMTYTPDSLITTGLVRSSTRAPELLLGGGGESGKTWFFGTKTMRRTPDASLQLE